VPRQPSIRPSAATRRTYQHEVAPLAGLLSRSSWMSLLRWVYLGALTCVGPFGLGSSTADVKKDRRPIPQSICRSLPAAGASRGHCEYNIQLVTLRQTCRRAKSVCVSDAGIWQDRVTVSTAGTAFFAVEPHARTSLYTQGQGYGRRCSRSTPAHRRPLRHTLYFQPMAVTILDATDDQSEDV
jgi:hypothetical protein